MNKTMVAVGSINKAWAAAIAAPLSDWVVEVIADQLLGFNILMPDSAQMALSALIVGLVVWKVPNLTPSPEPSSESEKT